jgi:hypothetical protein
MGRVTTETVIAYLYKMKAISYRDSRMLTRAFTERVLREIGAIKPKRLL